MFHFPAFPPHALYIQAQVTPHHWCWVSPFGHPRITARLATPRGLSQPPTSFIGSRCQGIHRVPLHTYKTHNKERYSRPLYSSQTPQHHQPPHRPEKGRSCIDDANETNHNTHQKGRPCRWCLRHPTAHPCTPTTRRQRSSTPPTPEQMLRDKCSTQTATKKGHAMSTRETTTNTKTVSSGMANEFKNDLEKRSP